MAYMSPGGAFSQGFQETMAKRAAEERQATLDQILLHREKRADEAAAAAEEDRKAGLKLRQDEADAKSKETERNIAIQERADMLPGDIPSAEQVARFKQLRVPFKAGTPVMDAQMPEAPPGIISPDVVPNEPVRPQGTPITPVGPMLAGRYEGSAAQRDVLQKKAEKQKYIDSLFPGPLKEAATFQSEMGSAEPAGVLALDKPVHSASYNEYNDYKAEEVKAGRRPMEFDAWATMDANRKKVTPPHETGWSVQKLTDKEGNEIVVRINAIDGRTEIVPDVLPLLPGSQRTRMYSARQVVSHFDDLKNEIEDLDRKGLLGPLAGRGNEFLAGKVGTTGDPVNDKALNKLRMGLLLAKSGTTMVHFGARGGQTYIDKMNQVIDSGKMSKDELLGALDEAAGWLNTYARDPRTADELLNEQNKKVEAAGPQPIRRKFDPKTGRAK